MLARSPQGWWWYEKSTDRWSTLPAPDLGAGNIVIDELDDDTMRRPEEARDAYNRVLAQSPKDVQARYGVFFAYVELEDFTAAYATIDSLVSDEPIWRRYRNDPTPHDNPERGYAETMAAQARFYGNQLGEAWDRLVRLSDAAPANGNTRLALYQVANARGWPRRAQTEAEIAASLAPRDVGARIALVEVAINAYRFSEAQRM